MKCVLRTLLVACVTLLWSGPPVRAAGSAMRVVFSGLTEGGTWDLWLGDAEGTSLSRAMETADTDERTPVLSPDRKHVAYTTSRGDLRLYNMYDRASRTLSVPVTGRCAWPAWGPDGTTLDFVEVLMGNGPDEGRIWRYDLKTAEAQKVADEPEVEGWPVASADGVLLFTNWTQSQASRLFLAAHPPSRPKLVWDRSLTLSGAAYLQMGRIAVVAGDLDGQKVILFTGGVKQREYIVPGATGRPVPYETSLLLTRIDKGVAGIYVMDFATGKTRAWSASRPKELVQMRDPDYK